jgi:hypothetical protein
MLPKIFSNIILAGIAIFIIYTMAPLFTDMFGKKKKKKSMSKEDFDDLVQRKIDQMSGNTNNPLTDKKSKGGAKKERSELDYLAEKSIFISEQDKDEIIELKKELQWGNGQGISRFQDSFKEEFGTEFDTSTLTSLLRNVLTKEFLLNKFKKDELSFTNLIYLVNNSHFLTLLSNDNEEILKALSKKLSMSRACVKLAVKLTLCKSPEAALEDYIDGQVITIIDDEIKLFLDHNTLKSSKELISIIKSKIDIVLPLEDITNKEASSYFNGEDKDIDKKKYKKLVSLYHPDKWTHYEKSNKIDQRLRENFDHIQKLYESVG